MFRSTTRRSATTDATSRTRRRPVARLVGSTLIAAAATAAVATPAYASTHREVVPAAQTAAVYHWGAIAVSPGTGNTGYSYDYPSRDKAIRAANGKCGVRDCRNLVWVANGCAAVAQAPNGNVGGGAAATLAEAERLAVKGSGSSRAKVYGWVCTTGHR